MIRHIVLFRMKEGASAKDAERLAGELRALKGNTGGHMAECVVAKDVVRSPNSYDIALNSAFESLEELEKYRVHPNHQKVLETIKELCSATVKIDYEE